MEVSRRLRVVPGTVRTWRRRFVERGPGGLCDDPRPGVPRKTTDADAERGIPAQTPQYSFFTAVFRVFFHGITGGSPQ
ncbi:helix-turn-helix domain-containing protein [Kitasatospora purpeofusca]|uniref:helix-turn-helix domain-containing protein n=1 Tax=Kitasatospora purpeofusca TaxID=67352 RepID=UPI00364AFFE8